MSLLDHLDESITSSMESDSALDTLLITHDPIHGSFSLPKIAWDIIDTPQFQRLRCIKQTGNTCYVYPGAEHTRFQHCLGVAHLSLEFGRTIKIKAPSRISEHQILLLCLAGLCHDLGHCAFSHLYDAHIIPMFNELNTESDGDSETDKTTEHINSHEEASYMILLDIWNKNKEIQETLTRSDIKTIGKMILGSPDKVPDLLKEELVWTDEDREEAYLYEVVSNDRTGIDVDKFDYLKRDSHYTGIPCTFDPQRLMTFLKLKHVGGRKGSTVVEYIQKSDELINAMWLSRDDLHRRAYQHRVVKCIDQMVMQMIKYCKDVLIPGTDIPLRRAHHRLDSYMLLTDDLIFTLAQSVPRAKSILDCIRERRLWETVATIISDTPLDMYLDGAKIGHAKFSKEHVYYVYHTGENPLHSKFFVDLITQAKGGEIHLRIKENTRWLVSDLD